jgi:hypothetical protein
VIPEEDRCHLLAGHRLPTLPILIIYFIKNGYGADVFTSRPELLEIHKSSGQTGSFRGFLVRATAPTCTCQMDQDWRRSDAADP